jgi:hypothetical protein
MNYSVNITTIMAKPPTPIQTMKSIKASDLVSPGIDTIGDGIFLPKVTEYAPEICLSLSSALGAKGLKGQATLALLEAFRLQTTTSTFKELNGKTGPCPVKAKLAPLERISFQLAEITVADTPEYPAWKALANDEQIAAYWSQVMAEHQIEIETPEGLRIGDDSYLE